MPNGRAFHKRKISPAIAHFITLESNTGLALLSASCDFWQMLVDLRLY